MFEDLSAKFKKLKMPEESLIKKIERLKKTPGSASAPADSASIVVPDMSLQIKKAQEEMASKLEEMVKAKTEQINANAEAIKEFDIKLNKIESAVSSSKNAVGEFKERLDKIDESLLELLSLYEVVSSTVNPFVGEKESVSNEKLEQIEKKIEALSQKAPEIPSDFKEQYDIKFKALESSLEELTKMMMETTTLNQDAIIKNVSEQVLERIKPVLEERVQQAQTVLIPPPAPSQLRPEQSAAPGKERLSQYQDDPDVKLKFLDNRAETSIILLNWIEFLLEKVGRNNLADVLEYYIDIGWISEEVSAKMMAYANGIDYYVERPTWKLLPEDHTKSLLFIEQLKGRKLDKSMLSKLERDVDKVIRGTEVYAV